MGGQTFSFFPSNVGCKIGQSELKKKAIAQQHWEERREEPGQKVTHVKCPCNLMVAQCSVLQFVKSSKSYV